MARDFRPKPKNKAPAPASSSQSSKPGHRSSSAGNSNTSSKHSTKHSTAITSATTSSSTTTADNSKAPPLTKTALKKQTKSQSAGYESEDSVDEETLLKEIQGFGGSADDLELVRKSSSKAKAKGDEDLDEAGISSEVASFLKQLQSDPSAPEPKSKSKPAKQSEPKQKDAKPKEAKQPAPEARASTKKNDAPVKEAQPKNSKKKKFEDKQAEAQQQHQPFRQTFSGPVQDGPKGKRMTFDDDGVAKPASTSRGLAGSTALRLEPAPHWSKMTLPGLPSSLSSAASGGKKAQVEPLSNERIAELLELGKQLLDEENQTYEAITSSETALSSAGGSVGTLSASDARFVRSLLSSEGGGTLSDRISALTLLVQSSPVHNVRAMDSLLAMARKKSREEAGKTTRALADWLAGGGGLSERKLFYFRDQPQLRAASDALASSDAAAQQAARVHLLLWAFEDHLKKYYFTYLQILEVQSHDPIAFVRKQAVTQIFLLLRDKPEQEQNLLRLLVNKLGDSERSVASKTSNHLLELLSAHPAMKPIVVREVANLVLKPTTSFTDKDGNTTLGHNAHARYYGVLTLNQTVLTSRDVDTANQLILLYFDLFEGVLKESEAIKGGKEEKDGEAQDGADGQPKKVDKGRWRDGKGKGKKGGKGKGKVKGKPTNAEPKAVADADAKMMAAILAGVRRAFPFAKIQSEVFEKHMATLFRITHSGTFNICIQALQLIFQLTISNPHPETSAALGTTAIADRFYRVLYDSLLDPRLETSSKQAMYLNLVFQALKADQELDRTKAFVKRICQIFSLHQPPFICGCLFLLGKLFQRQPGLRTMLNDPEDDDEEHFQDVVESDDEADGAEGETSAAAAAAAASGAAKTASRAYSGRKRDPRFSNAGLTCLWDVVPLLKHFHPSVALHARQLLQSESITSSADLSLNTLSHFLDRFVYRNPKTKAASRGVSIMQPTATAAQSGAGVTRSRDRGMGEESYVNDAKFWQKSAEAVPVDQLFFHQFFNLKSKRPDVATKKGGDDELALSDIDEEVVGRKKPAKKEEMPSSDDESDEEEKEIWKAMKASMPGKEDLKGLEDSDDDEADGDDNNEFDYADSEAEREIKGLVDAASSDDSDDSDDDDGPRVLEGMEFSDADEDNDDDAAVQQDDVSDDDGEDVFEEDEEDLLPFAEFEGSDDEDDEEEEQTTGGKKRAGKKRGADGETTASRRKKRKALPMFASAEDYAHMLDSDDEGGV
ncbi:RNA-binding ribosome biosynthesis protein mak21 [Thecaphora frezii]